jgi:hypothetical protein
VADSSPAVAVERVREEELRLWGVGDAELDEGASATKLSAATVFEGDYIIYQFLGRKGYSECDGLRKVTNHFRFHYRYTDLWVVAFVSLASWSSHRIS